MATRPLKFLLLQTTIILLPSLWDLSHGFATPSSSSWESLRMYRNDIRHHHHQPSPMYFHLNMRIKRRDYRTATYNYQYDNTNESSSPTSSSSSSPSQPSRQPSPPSLKVGIIGSGSIAFGTASLAASLGHDPMIWSPSGASTSELLEHASTSTSSSSSSSNTDRMTESNMTSQIQSTGALSHTFNVRIARSLEELVQCNDNVWVLALPVNGHKKVMEELAPHVVELIMEKKQRQQEQKQQHDKDGHDNGMVHIIISSHASLGAVYFMQLLRDEKQQYLLRNGHSQKTIDPNPNDDIGVRITAWGTTAITARKTSGTSVNVLTIRQFVDFCTVPSIPERAEQYHHQKDQEMTTTLEPKMISSVLTKEELLADGYNLCTALFGPRFKRRKGGLLAISLSNLNPQNHLGIVLGNMSRMDPPPPPPPKVGNEMTKQQTTPDTTIEPWYQGQNVTPNIGRLMEALDRERLDIAQALDIDVRTIYEHFSWSFHVPMETPVVKNNETGFESSSSSTTTEMRPLTVSEMNQQMHHHVHNDVLGPSSPDSRYVLEDVPYGLVLTVVFGRLVNRPATLHEAGIRILSAMYGRDFMVENELLQGLGLLEDDIPCLDKWREMAYSGCFSDG